MKNQTKSKINLALQDYEYFGLQSMLVHHFLQTNEHLEVEPYARLQCILLKDILDKHFSSVFVRLEVKLSRAEAFVLYQFCSKRPQDQYLSVDRAVSLQLGHLF